MVCTDSNKAQAAAGPRAKSFDRWTAWDTALGMERLSHEVLEHVRGFLPDHLVVGNATATHRRAWSLLRSARAYAASCWRNLCSRLALQTYEEDLRAQDWAELRRQDEEKTVGNS